MWPNSPARPPRPTISCPLARTEVPTPSPIATRTALRVPSRRPDQSSERRQALASLLDFGAFVNFFGAKDGLVHVSQIANQRVNKVSDVLHEGQMVKVKLVGFDDRGKTRLSMKVVDQTTGEDLTQKEPVATEA